jgi:hypothetical protein
MYKKQADMVLASVLLSERGRSTWKQQEIIPYEELE